MAKKTMLAQPANGPGRWEIRPSEGKGRGVFATEDIPMGSLVMLEKPALKLPHPGLNKRIRTVDVLREFDKMTPSQQSHFSRLSDSGHQDIPHKLHRTFLTNAIVANTARDFHVYLNFSMINHSCLPNALNKYREETGQQMVIATKSIAKNEEITITYQGNLIYETAETRARLFSEAWGFQCGCKACKGPLSRASDIRRVMLAALFAILERHDVKQQASVVAMKELTLSVLKDKHLCRLDFAHIDAFSEADYTFLWWLEAKLLETEGVYIDNLGVAYQRAAVSLQKRLTIAGEAGKKVEHLEAYFINIKTWWKIWYNVERITRRPQGVPAWGLGDDTSDRAMVGDGLVAYHGYDQYGICSLIALPAAGLRELENGVQTGVKFCKDYKKKFGHLYRC
jgi:hypothetical protein